MITESQLKDNTQGAQVAPFFILNPTKNRLYLHPSTDCDPLPPACASLNSGTRALDSARIGIIIGSVQTNQMNFTTLTRTAIRTALIQKNKQTCSALVKGMGLDPKRHKGTIHAIMVDMESEGILSATMKGTRRDVWSIHTNQIRKRDRIIAALIG